MNKLKAKIELAGLSFKKEIIIFIILNISSISISLFAILYFKNPIFLAFALFLLIILDYYYLSRYSSILKINNGEITTEFVSLLPFFRTYLKNHYSIYQALKELVSFSSDRLADRLNKLIGDIDEDKSITPFINFANQFDSSNIEQLMISIYQMIDEGNDSPYLLQFESIFSKLSDNLYLSIIEKRNKELGNLSIFPLIGSSLLIVMISFGVMEVIGGMINGL